MKIKSYLLISIITLLISTGTAVKKETEGNQQKKTVRDNGEYDADEPVLVHIVPHSFNLDFFEMVDHYFPNNQQMLLQDHFDKVFDQVFNALEADSTRTFSHFETKFFSNWYYKQDEKRQQSIKGLVNEGKFEFITGGWDMHDEAIPTYQDILLNIQKGHMFLMKEFGDKPRVAWSLDRSGHSVANARLLSESGIESLFLLNIDPQEKKKKIDGQSMEFVWRPLLKHLGRKAEIFTHIINDFEISPFDLPLFDMPNKTQPVNNDTKKNDTQADENDEVEEDPIDDPFSPHDNKTQDNNSTTNSTDPFEDEEEIEEEEEQEEEEREKEDAQNEETDEIPERQRLREERQRQQRLTMKQYAINTRKIYNTNHILMFVGAKINFEKAEFYFEDLQELISTFNKHNDDVKLMFSNLYYYSLSVAKHNVLFEANYYDMMPYGTDRFEYYTGQYSSRPMIKGMVRQASNMWYSASKFYFKEIMLPNTTKDAFGSYDRSLYFLSDTISTAQSSDIITGTCRASLAQQVTDKIETNIESNFQRMAFLMNDYAKKIAGINSTNAKWNACFRFNITDIDCEILSQKIENSTVAIATFNPSLHTLNHIKFPVPDGHFQVQIFNETNKTFQNVSATVLCQMEESSQQHCLMFVEITLKGQQIGFITLKRNSSVNLVPELKKGDTVKIENNMMYLQYKYTHEEDGAIFLIQKKHSQEMFHFGFDLKYYASYQGSVGSRSGAAIFRPKHNESISYSNLESINYQQSSIVSQITLTYTNSRQEEAIVTARLYNGNPMIEWDVYLGGIPLFGEGREVTVNFQSLDINNQGVFYTDSNGLEMQQRWFNYRPNYNYISNAHHDIANNYYPVTSAIIIKDELQSTQMTIMTTKTQGGSSIKNGRIELMHNRRLLKDDKASREIILNETHPNGKPYETRSRYYLQIFNEVKEVSYQRTQQILNDEQPQIFFTFNYTLDKKLMRNYSQPLSTYEELAVYGVPKNSKISYHAINSTMFFVRLENLDDLFDSDYTNTAYIDAEALMFHIYNKIYGGGNFIGQKLSITEMSLTGNEKRTEMILYKSKWGAVDDDFIDETELPRDKLGSTYSMEPQRIRTFMAKMESLVPPKTMKSEFIE